MSLAVFQRSPTAAALFRSQLNPYAISVGQICTGTGFPLFSFSPPITEGMFILKGQKRVAWDPSKYYCVFGNEGALDRKLLSFRS